MFAAFSKIFEVAQTKVIIVDKDLNALNAVKRHLPAASIQLCKFHVFQAVNREIRKSLTITIRGSMCSVL